MKRVTLRFPDASSLHAFTQLLHPEHSNVSIEEQLLTCNCSEQQISQALMHYRAQIVDEVEERSVTGN
jgi:hypothetical protein